MVVTYVFPCKQEIIVWCDSLEVETAGVIRRCALIKIQSLTVRGVRNKRDRRIRDRLPIFVHDGPIKHAGIHRHYNFKTVGSSLVNMKTAIQGIGGSEANGFDVCAAGHNLPAQLMIVEIGNDARRVLLVRRQPVCILTLTWRSR